MKRTLTIFILSLAALPALVFADTSSTIILPDTLMPMAWAQVQSLLNGLQSYTSTIIGVLLALIVIGELIVLLRNPNK